MRARVQIPLTPPKMSIPQWGMDIFIVVGDLKGRPGASRVKKCPGDIFSGRGKIHECLDAAPMAVDEHS